MSHHRVRRSRPEPSVEFFASCPEGFETSLARELKSLHLRRVRPLKGRVSFAGEAIDGERACLWSRLASRVFAVVGRVDAYDANELYRGAYQLPWEDILAERASFAVSAKGTSEELRNSHYTALCVKDAICDRIADKLGVRPAVDVEHPDARIAVTISHDRASIQLDLSGVPLFRRLPRAATQSGATASVMRPDYAALVLEQAGFLSACRLDAEPAPATLIDLNCCGGGIVLEAAQAACHQAPGLSRRDWGFRSWKLHDEQSWQSLLDEARQAVSAAEEGEQTIRIIACEDSAAAKTYAERVLRSAGVMGYVTFARTEDLSVTSDNQEGRDARHLYTVADISDLTLTEQAARIPLAQDILSRYPSNGETLALLTRDKLLERMVGTQATAITPIMPANEDAHLMVWDDPRQGKIAEEEGRGGAPANTQKRATSANSATVDLGKGKPVAVLVPESEQFANRLKKNARLRRKWAKRENVTCYRVYDADLPDYAAAIDLYEGTAETPGRWLVIAEYEAPKTVDAELARARLMDMLTIAPIVLDVPADHVHARARTRSRGGSQYRKRNPRANDRASQALIQEGDLTFEVNFDSYLDTGIFLDHRITRGLVRTIARENEARYFLNLFAYTGTASCYAADAGVEETVTVDLSNTYLDWAERNMHRNGFTGASNHYVKADVLQWIQYQRSTSNRWDLIFCDPPTFSNSSSMNGRTWDVQRDHVELIEALVDLLMPHGQAIFSCNLRNFRPEIEALKRQGILLEDITAQTIPEDFARNQKIHHCYIVRKAS